MTQEAARAASVILVIEPARSGGLRVASPQLGDWCAVARTPHALAHAITTAVRAAHNAGVAGAVTVEQLLSGELVDPARLMQERRASDRADNYSIADWTPLPGGAWMSPARRVFPAHTSMAANRRARWLAAGLPLDVPGHEGEASCRQPSSAP